VTLAVVISVLFFSVLPLMFIGMRVLIEDYVTREQAIILPSGDVTTNEGLTGIESDLITDREVLTQIGVSVVFLIIAFFAWRGRPSFMRYVLMISVVGIAGFQLFQAFTAFDDQLEGGSLDNLIVFLRQGSVVISILIPLYVVWYLNRGPARAFYRGYYLEEDWQPEATASHDH
jgi:succinate dehydrogenase hydrophobic anchor subunit